MKTSPAASVIPAQAGTQGSRTPVIPAEAGIQGTRNAEALGPRLRGGDEERVRGGDEERVRGGDELPVLGLMLGDEIPVTGQGKAETGALEQALRIAARMALARRKDKATA